MFFTRMLPIVRTFVSLPAGVARMPFWRFSLLHACSAACRGCSRSRSSASRSASAGSPGRTSLHYVDYAVARRRSWRSWSTSSSSAAGRAPSSPWPDAVRTARAVLLGALHGPAELVPVSSSAHVALVPWLLGWQRELDPARRKELEVAAARRDGDRPGLGAAARGAGRAAPARRAPGRAPPPGARHTVGRRARARGGDRGAAGDAGGGRRRARRGRAAAARGRRPAGGTADGGRRRAGRRARARSRAGRGAGARGVATGRDAGGRADAGLLARRGRIACRGRSRCPCSRRPRR